jgi:hypothetical protein
MTPPQQHCDHECVCCDFPDDIVAKQRCPRVGCQHDTRSRPAPSPHAPNGSCPNTINICPEVDCDKCREAAAQAREEVLDALDRDWKGRYVEDAVAEIRRFPESLRTGGDK